MPADTSMFANLAPFAFNLFSSLTTSASSGENVLFSPLSIASSLAMVWAGVTKSSSSDLEFQKVMAVQSQSHIPNLLSIMNWQNKDNSNLSIANSIWTSKDVNSQYLIDVESYASVETSLPSTFDPINDWVSTQTKGKIPELFEANKPLDPLTVAIAVNAIHFQGSWMSEFDQEHTFGGKFTTLKNEDVTANFMTKTVTLPIAEDVDELGGASILRLDYAAETKRSVSSDSKEEAGLCALFVLPGENTQRSLQQAVDGLSTVTSWKDILMLDGQNANENMLFRRHQVSVHIPKFKLSQGPESIKSVLREAGLSDVFDGTNQFLHMTPNDPDTHLDDIMAAATLEVTEKGTVATAATGAVMMSRSLPMTMEFNRPFIMMVMHVSTGTPLFVAQVSNPEFI